MSERNKSTPQHNSSALHVMDGIGGNHDGMKKSRRRRFVKRKRTVSIDDLYKQIIAGSRRDLAQAITLIESVRSEDQQLAQQLLNKLIPKTGNSVRIGVSGVPGAGKSTFIEAFGLMLKIGRAHV